VEEDRKLLNKNLQLLSSLLSLACVLTFLLEDDKSTRAISIILLPVFILPWLIIFRRKYSKPHATQSCLCKKVVKILLFSSMLTGPIVSLIHFLILNAGQSGYILDGNDKLEFILISVITFFGSIGLVITAVIIQFWREQWFLRLSVLSIIFIGLWVLCIILLI